MVTIEDFRTLALLFEEAVELPHFDKASFRINKKIFATLSEKEKTGCLKFSEIDQSVFCSYDPSVIFPVPNKWGKQGWTFIQLEKIDLELLNNALIAAYCLVAPKRLAVKYLNNPD